MTVHAQQRSIPLCPRCGAPNPGAGGGGMIVPVRTDNRDDIARLFVGVADELRCQVCGGGMGVSPTLAVVAPSDREVAVSVTSLADDPEIAADIVKDLEGRGFGVTLTSGPGEVRGWVMGRWAQRLPRLLDALQADSNQQAAILAGDLSTFDAETFVAAHVALSLQPPGSPIGLAPGADVDEALDAIAGLQARSLLALCEIWVQVGSEDLERDLARQLPKGSLLPGTAEKLVPALTALLDQQISAGLAYRVNALLATVCREADLPNPKGREWADVWLRHDVLLAAEQATGKGASEANQSGAVAALKASQISRRRAESTLSHPDVYNAAARLIAEGGPHMVGHIVEAARRIGYKELGSELFDGMRPLEDAVLSPQQILDALAPSAPARSPSLILLAANPLVRLILDLTPEIIWQLADAIADFWPGSFEAKIESEAWAGQHLNMLGAAEALLDRIGRKPRPSEALLPLATRSSLEYQRAVALRNIGLARESVTALTELLAELERDPQSAEQVGLISIRRSLGMAMRRAGDRESAVALLQDISTAGDLGQQLETRHALLVTLVELGRLEQALAVAEDARRLAAGPYRDLRASFDAARAGLLLAASRPADAETALRAVPTDRLDEPEILIPFASALLSHPTLLDSPEGRQMGATTLEHLNHAWEERGRTHFSEVAEHALRLMAFLVHRTGVGDELALWQAFADLSDASGRPDPMATIALIARAEDPESARVAIDRAYDALATAFSGTRRLSESYLSTRSLWGFLEMVQHTLAGSGIPAEYQRVVAELGRDVIGRLGPSAPNSATAREPRPAAPWNEVVARMPGRLAVLEWIADEDVLLPLVTVVGGGDVRTDIASRPPIDIARLGKRIGARVSSWHTGRVGDPFDLTEWHAAAEWIAEVVGERTEAADAVVLIEHPVASRVPWHVALTPHWPACSVPSWTSLLAEGNRPPEAVSRMGCVIVPRFGEDQEVLEAFETVRAGLTEMSTIFGRPTLDLEEGTNADHEELRRMLAGTDLCVVLCHGYAPANEPGVAWLLADSGALPLRGSAEAASRLGRRHQFTWRDCDALEAASAVIVSAACSTASAHYAGAGEQLGLYSALRRHGTRAFIAPRWDIPASAVLPVYSDAIRRMVQDGDTPASAVRSASLTAADRLPRWLAYAPAVAGSWWVKPSYE
jgi:tetratricopeptide (TPR) repeat protein